MGYTLAELEMARRWRRRANARIDVAVRLLEQTASDGDIWHPALRGALSYVAHSLRDAIATDDYEHRTMASLCWLKRVLQAANRIITACIHARCSDNHSTITSLSMVTSSLDTLIIEATNLSEGLFPLTKRGAA